MNLQHLEIHYSFIPFAKKPVITKILLYVPISVIETLSSCKMYLNVLLLKM